MTARRPDLAKISSAVSSKVGLTLRDANDRAVTTWGYRSTTTFARLFKVSKPFRQMLGGSSTPSAAG
ncbi:hypothetical protein [Nonomuraea sp. KM90]|uniref:hypothetical protein n=1 Tax=Nonomuraea sp. KM90 TaxID=3457428 RepID=UPI003FCCA2DE